MKKINNEQILDKIYDLADARGMRIDDFMAELEDNYGDAMPDTQGLPEEIVKELESARENKKEMRKQQRIKKGEEENAEEIKRFRALFPNVSADDIPQSVWEEVADGVGLSHAYALYTVTENGINKHAEEVNKRNGRMNASLSADGSTEPVFTKELVEKMSDKDIKSNYKGILKAMKNWRF